MSDTVEYIRIDATTLSVALYKDSRLFNNNEKRERERETEREREKEKKTHCVMSFKSM